MKGVVNNEIGFLNNYISTIDRSCVRDDAFFLILIVQLIKVINSRSVNIGNGWQFINVLKLLVSGKTT